MGEIEDRAAGRLVNAAVLHADKAVFHDVDDADAVGAADGVQALDDLAGLHLLAVERHGCAGLKVDGHIAGGIRGLEGGNAHLQEAGLVVVGLVGRILQVEALVAQMPEVLVLGIVRLAADLQRHIVGLGVVDLLVAALDVPLAPGGDDLHARREALDGQLKAHLVVALAGGAVGDGVRALGEGDLRQLLADHRAGEGRAQQIALIVRAHLHRGDDDVVHHLVHEVGDDQLAGAGLQRLFLQPLQLVGLPDVAGHRDDLGVVIVLLQPGDDDGRIQAAGIGEHDFFDAGLFHKYIPPCTENSKMRIL